MKGFIRVLEAIIASIILIASVSYFFLPTTQQTSWDDVVLSTRTKESLIALEKSGKLAGYVKNNDAASLNNDLRKTLPPNIEFSLEVRDIPNDIIYVECFCSETEKDDLESLLAPLRFGYKDREIDVRIQRLDNLNNINPRTDVAFIIGYENLNPYMSALNSFLDGGGTIFMLGHLTENQVSDGFMNSVFDLRWTGSGGGEGIFYSTVTPSKVSYKIAKYYRGLTGKDPASAAFSEFSGGGVNQIEVTDKSVIITSPGNQISYVKINQFIVNNHGRTVWFSGYDYAKDTQGAQETKNLTKAALMWASGEHYKMDNFKKTPAPSFSESSLLSSIGGDQFELSLLFWKVFF
ncbi:MAG: hypothetical protein HYW26_02525 [Candidatus Aenigmarchaeota archaeon]|nr:hypothetical protein [Candidatus Aenigmarchaeota archaeon]